MHKNSNTRTQQNKIKHKQNNIITHTHSTIKATNTATLLTITPANQPNTDTKQITKPISSKQPHRANQITQQKENTANKQFITTKRQSQTNPTN